MNMPQIFTVFILAAMMIFPSAGISSDLDTERDTAAHDPGVYKIVIKDHKFSPDVVSVPAGQKIKLVIHNQDSTPEEFESDDLRREKIIAGHSSANITVGPLKPGKYHFFGEFNLTTASGHLVVE